MPKAFSLIEVTLAIGIAGFCLLAIFSMLPMGITTNSQSLHSTAAASLAQAIVQDLRSTPPGSSSSPMYSIAPDTSASTEIFLTTDGAHQSSASTADYKAVLTISSPASGGALAPKFVRILISWPAQATNPLNTFELFTALDRN